MPLPRTRTTGWLRRLAALGLVAWLAGAGCVLGCSAVIASAHDALSQKRHARNDSHSAAQPDSCAAMSGHDCCEGVEREEGEERDERAPAGAEIHGNRTAMHCPLGGRHTSDPARKVRVDTTPTVSTPALQTPAPQSSYAPAPYAADVLVRDRGSTYLRCCVFLI